MAQYASNILFSIDTALQLKNGVNKETINAQKNLTNQDSTVQFITPSGGTQIVKLPAVRSGLSFLICNLDTTNTLKVWTNTDVELVNMAANNSAAVECSASFSISARIRIWDIVFGSYFCLISYLYLVLAPLHTFKTSNVLNYFGFSKF